MKTIQTLLSENKQIPKFLHDTQGFDFQKPVTVIKGEGKFTIRSLIALLAEENIEFSENHRAIIFIKASSDFGVYDYCYAVLLEPNRFVTDIPCKSYKYKLDTFYTKNEFENVRKNKCEYYYLVIQEKSNLCENKEPKLNLYERLIYKPTAYEKCGDGKGNSWIYRINLKERNRNTEEFEHRIDTYNIPKTSDINEIIDKSGYLLNIYRADRKWRLYEYKAKKRKSEFLATDHSATVAELEKQLNALKYELTNTFIAATNYDDIREIITALYKYSYALKDFAYFKDNVIAKTYKSNTDAEYTAKNVRLNIDEARKIINTLKDKNDNA